MPNKSTTHWYLFWSGCGRDDYLLYRSIAFDATLTQAGIDREFHLTKGVHNCEASHRCFAMLAPKLFRD